MLCSLSSECYFIGNIIGTDCLKANGMLKFPQNVALDHLREKIKPQCKLSYKLFKEEDVYNTLLEISPYPTLIQLKFYLDSIHNCVTVVVRWVFYSNFPFALPLTKQNLDYFCINDNETKGVNGYKRVLKEIRFSQKKILKVSFRSEIHNMC